MVETCATYLSCFWLDPIRCGAEFCDMRFVGPQLPYFEGAKTFR